MRFPVSLRRIAVLAWMWACCHAPTSAQESQAPPTPESFLKIINEQIAAMSNTTFELDYSYANRTGTAGGVAEALFDENGNPVVVNTEANPGMTLGMRMQIQFASLNEYCVTQMSTNRRPSVEHLAHPVKGNARVFHSHKAFVDGVKNTAAYSLSFSILPMAFVERYRNVISGSDPSALAWVIESHRPEQTTVTLRVQGKVRLRATFASPSQMCTSLVTYDPEEKVLDLIEAVAGSTVVKLPFLATTYTNNFRGQYLKKCEITSAIPLPPGSMKPYKKPDGYTAYTVEGFKQRLEAEAKERARQMERQRNR